MSTERIIYSFVLAWIALIAILIILDWLGNPNRGAFRPKGERPPRDRESRRAERNRRRLEEDASVRTALRDAYGASSLRLTWSADHEQQARQLDDALVVEPRDDALDVASREVSAVDRTLVIGDPLPNPDEAPPEPDDDPPNDDSDRDGSADGEPDGDNEPDDELSDTDDDDDNVADDDNVDDEDNVDSEDNDGSAPATSDPEVEVEEPPARSRGWRVGADPLSLTARGDEPAPGTVRTRVWKNHGVSRGWGQKNRERLQAGKAPRRVNPMTGRTERAIVDVETGRASWGSEPVDPFGDEDG